MSDTSTPTDIRLSLQENQRHVRLVKITSLEGATFEACAIQTLGPLTVTFTEKDHTRGGWGVPYQCTPMDLSHLALHYHDIKLVEVDHDAEQRRREHSAYTEAQAVKEAYGVISRALNGGKDEFVLAAIENEHPTLVGKLWNVMQAVCELRDGDGRLRVPNMTLGDLVDRSGWTSDTKLYELRTPFI
jgi:hypothetical protein